MRTTKQTKLDIFKDESARVNTIFNGYNDIQTFLQVKSKEELKKGYPALAKLVDNVDNIFINFILANEDNQENKIFLQEFLETHQNLLNTNLDNLKILFYSVLFAHYKVSDDLAINTNNTSGSVPINLVLLLDNISSLKDFLDILTPYTQESLQHFPVIKSKFLELVDVLKIKHNEINIQLLNQLNKAVISDDVLTELLRKFLLQTINNSEITPNNIYTCHALQLVLTALNKGDGSCFSKISTISGLITITSIVLGDTLEINQGGTNLCGIDVLTRYMAKNSPYIFAKLALSLLFKGQASYNDFSLAANQECLSEEQDFIVALMSSIKNYNSTFGYSRFVPELFETVVGVTLSSELENLFTQIGYKVTENTFRLINFTAIDKHKKAYTELNALISKLYSSSNCGIPVQFNGIHLTDFEHTQKIILPSLEVDTDNSIAARYNCDKNNKKIDAQLHPVLAPFCESITVVKSIEHKWLKLPHYVYMNSCGIEGSMVNMTFETWGNVYNAKLTIDQFSDLFLGYIHPTLEDKDNLDARLEKEEQRKLLIFSDGFRDSSDNNSPLKEAVVAKGRIIGTYLSL